MSDHRQLPADPLEFVKRCVRLGSILWTHHVNMRFGQRRVTRDMVLTATDTFEVIEAYPEDKYLPSYLIRAEYGDTTFHVVFAVDVAENNVRVVTAYLPDSTKWDPDFRERLKRP